MIIPFSSAVKGKLIKINSNAPLNSTKAYLVVFSFSVKAILIHISFCCIISSTAESIGISSAIFIDISHISITLFSNSVDIFKPPFFIKNDRLFLSHRLHLS